MNQRKFYTRFTTEKSCILHLKSTLEKGSVCCPKCGNKNIIWNKKHLHWRCSCMHRVSVKSMTFMKDSNISLLKWFEAIYIFVNTKKPCSDLEFSRKIGIKRYKTVHYMLLKIRKQMSEDLNRFEFDSSMALKLNKEQPCNLLIQKSKTRKNDAIKLQLPEEYNTQFSFLKSPNYCMKKIVFKTTKNWSKLPRIKECSKKWINIIRINFIKIIKGIHHYTTTFHLQLYLDEYAYKYNSRFLKNKFDYFLNIDVDWQKSAQS